jgi:hypothetical protein
VLCLTNQLDCQTSLHTSRLIHSVMLLVLLLLYLLDPMIAHIMLPALPLVLSSTILHTQL